MSEGTQEQISEIPLYEQLGLNLTVSEPKDEAGHWHIELAGPLNKVEKYYGRMIGLEITLEDRKVVDPALRVNGSKNEANTFRWWLAGVKPYESVLTLEGDSNPDMFRIHIENNEVAATLRFESDHRDRADRLRGFDRLKTDLQNLK